MKTALITGSGRKSGLGFEVAKQLGAQGYQIIIAARKSAQVTQRVAELKNLGFQAHGVVLDLTDENSISQAVSTVQNWASKLDVLVNNAAVFGDFTSVLDTDIKNVEAAFNTNFLGTWQVTQKFYPLLANADTARIVNVSSGAGSFADPVYGILNGSMGMPVSTYALTKLVINGLTVKMAKEFSQDNVLVNAVCPDVVNTSGHDTGFGRPVSEGAKSIVWAATLPDDGPTGGFYRDGQPLPW